jgi:hypothetical protein
MIKVNCDGAFKGEGRLRRLQKLQPFASCFIKEHLIPGKIIIN